MKKVSVNKDLCVCCGFCYGNCGEVFGMDADGTSKVIKPLVEDNDDLVISTVEGCPTGALSIEDVKDEQGNGDDGTCECSEECACENCSCEK